uniref:Uncharacterized protein n=1 Tax=Cryptomonas curvata TaxID=233186 RepID=A0A7S0N0E2_9CRYP|mmetsp:Transcript_58849/g.122947  ORF Transcript_58849/g.122947 Transcript_58849/m.122947 type:complete len:109 (+) Transcript_58849:51-377(+)
MQTPSHTDQDQFDQLQVADPGFTSKHSYNDTSNVTTQRSEMRAIEIDEILYLLAVFAGPKRGTGFAFAPQDPASNTSSGNTTLPQTQMPPPTRYTRRSRTAGPRPISK